MIDVKHYLYHRGSGKSNAAKEQGKAHYELYKATLQECKDNLSKPETHDDLAIRMRAFFRRDCCALIFFQALARSRFIAVRCCVLCSEALSVQ